MKTTLLTLSLVAFLFTFSSQTFAATFTVNQSGDAGDLTCDATCTLRDAVNNANNAVTDDTISFDAGLTTITLTNEIVIENAGTLTINGNGADVLTIDGGAGTNRIFYTNLATVNISGVTLRDGNGTGTDSNFNGSGGAIYAYGGALILNRVHVLGNSARGGGGGVYFVFGIHRISDSTFSGNSSGSGAVYNDRVLSLVITNSTISGNTSTNQAAGISQLSGFSLLRNVTITNNSSAAGNGGIYVFFSGTINLGNTIVAGNNQGGDGREIYIEELFGEVVSAGSNLIGDSVEDSANTGNRITYKSSDILDTPPLLGLLQDNGGTTPTHALLPNSPAINKGNNASAPLPFDQRGFERFVGVIVDIGAVEFTPAKSRKRVRFF